MTRHAHPSAGAGRAAAAAAGFGTLALLWTVTGHGYPFGPGDAGNPSSPLRALPADVGAPLFAAVLLTAAVAALVLRGGARAPALTGYLGLVAAALLVVVPDTRLLTLAGYLPIVIVGFPFGYPPVDLGDFYTVTAGCQVLAAGTGLLLARAALRAWFRDRDACLTCGRGDRTAGWTTPAGAARWGRWAAWTAAAIPAAYAVVRLAWAAGIPLGIPASFLREMQDTGLVWAGAGLGAFALAGSVLTLGLVQRWGEVFPRWLPGLAGRRVPIRLATVPATVVAVLVLSASVGFLTSEGFLVKFTGGVSLATLPVLAWPLWGVALGAAALAYHLRRRGACAVCGRGAPGVVPAVRTGAY